MKKMILVLGLILVAGCQCPEKVILREAMDQGTRTIRANEKAWAEKLVAYPVGTTDPRTGQPSTGKNLADQIPPLTPSQFNNGAKTHADYEKLVADDRANTK